MDKDEIDNEIKEITKAVIPERKKHRAEYQMTLGSLIKALRKERTGLPVIISSVYHGYEDRYPANPHSYHGYSEDLAFEPLDTPITVAEFLTMCESIIKHSSFQIGNAFTINSPVWISKQDTASKNAIADVVSNVNQVTLVTKEIKEEEVSDATK